jgi:hypothetical protein
MFLRLLQTVFVCALMLFVTTGFADKKEKMLICHVGNEEGPGGEVYDPTCVPEEANGYFCADAGKIDLIVVSKKAKHLGNPSHTYDGIPDYDPSEMSASGVGTEDSNGDGIDDGCEPSQVLCPCWAESDLQSITAENLNSSLSCSQVLDFPGFAVIQNVYGSTPGVEGGFNTNNFSGYVCGTRDITPYSSDITEEEANACFDQIAVRCSALGDPIN